jgi:dTDP-4-dehydrorhamnose 3,5-epimerase
MRIQELDIVGAYLIENYLHKDNRGLFVKPFSNAESMFNGQKFDINEIYYSISNKNVIRGMHFQTPSMDHEKLIYLTQGRITDVLLDIRKHSPTYKQYMAIDLSAHINALFVPKGVAHGFLSKQDNTIVVYNQSTVHSSGHDEGILWNSFGYDWGLENPILSDRDRSFKCLKEFVTPF